jgi:hypothetical protein
LLGGAALLACILLTKQLAVFSAFSLGLLLAADIVFHTRAWKAFLLYSTFALAVFLSVLGIADLFLGLKAPYFSHLVYVWTEGIFQSGLIAGNGFNLWVLLGRDMWGSAHVPVFASLPQVTPYGTGQILFLLLAGLITISLALALRAVFRSGKKFLDRETLLNFILHLALINLCFNVFLTGTRDRYLFHFYPYIMLAWAGLGGFSRFFPENRFSLLALGSNLYGLFIIVFLTMIDFRLGSWPNILLAVFHLGLFSYLLVITLKYQRFVHHFGLLFRKG